jgi:putative nucleic acid binding protein
MKRTAFIVIILLLAGLAITVYLMYTHEMPDIVVKDPTYTLTAGEILLAFDADETVASRKYIDKIIQLSATVKQVDTSGALTLGENHKPGEIIMAIDPRHKKALAAVVEGAPITVQGVCSSYSKGQAAGDDLLSGLGATIRFSAGGIKAQ